MRKLLFHPAWWLCTALSLLPAQDEAPYAEITPFLKKHCIECHGPDKDKGGVRFDILEDMDEELWTEMHEQILSGEMPPEKQPQPSKEDRKEITDAIYRLLTNDDVILSSGFRRLNKREYGNTIRDLLGLEKGAFDPALYLFEDSVEHGFDTNAESLVISNELLLEYMKAAEASLDAALYIPSREKPPTKLRPYALDKLRGGSRRFVNFNKKAATLRIGGSAMMYPSEAQRHVPVSGKYRIRVTACGTGRDNYPIKFTPKEGPIKMGLGMTTRSSDGLFRQRQEELNVDLRDEMPKSFEVDMWLSKGFFPYISFTNGSSKPAVFTRAALRRGQMKPKDAKTAKGYIGPGLKVTEFSIEGPLDLTWPPPSYATTFWVKDIPDLSDEATRTRILKQFIWRAFRRAVHPEDLAPYLNYLSKRHQEIDDWQEAMLNTFTAVLSSHDFLYIYEGKGELTSFELVNRISYFLWSTMPDLELFKLAMNDQIKEEEIYIEQLKRMLKSPKAEAFKKSFVTQWLSLDILGTMAPDIKDKQYKDYYRKGLEKAFRTETEMFFNYIVNENRPVREFLDSDYTFVNQALADLYEIPYKGGSGFSYVKLDRSSKRGGLLGHGSIHALTSNGVETLPVTRGHWVLDELLGVPPPPAPAEVPAIVPDLNGLTTVRQQLVKHREDPACYKCHKMMDPPGLALEAYDLMGRYRTHYGKKKKIDTTGEFLGRRFDDLGGFKKILVDHESAFAKNLAIKIVEYAKGRKLNVKDIEMVDEIISHTEKKEYRFQNILAQILKSDLMKNR